jgi:hypothetical protein
MSRTTEDARALLRAPRARKEGPEVLWRNVNSDPKPAPRLVQCSYRIRSRLSTY